MALLSPINRYWNIILCDCHWNYEGASRRHRPKTTKHCIIPIRTLRFVALLIFFLCTPKTDWNVEWKWTGSVKWKLLNRIFWSNLICASTIELKIHEFECVGSTEWQWIALQSNTVQMNIDDSAANESSCYLSSEALSGSGHLSICGASIDCRKQIRIIDEEIT